MIARTIVEIRADAALEGAKPFAIEHDGPSDLGRVNILKCSPLAVLEFESQPDVRPDHAWAQVPPSHVLKHSYQHGVALCGAGCDRQEDAEPSGQKQQAVHDASMNVL
jgi:hypothetical protein